MAPQWPESFGLLGRNRHHLLSPSPPLHPQPIATVPSFLPLHRDQKGKERERSAGKSKWTEINSNSSSSSGAPQHGTETLAEGEDILREIQSSMWRWGPPCFCSLWVGRPSSSSSFLAACLFCCRHFDHRHRWDLFRTDLSIPMATPLQPQIPTSSRTLNKTTKTLTLSSPKSPTLLIPIPIPACGGVVLVGPTPSNQVVGFSSPLSPWWVGGREGGKGVGVAGIMHPSPTTTATRSVGQPTKMTRLPPHPPPASVLCGEEVAASRMHVGPHRPPPPLCMMTSPVDISAHLRWDPRVAFFLDMLREPNLPLDPSDPTPTALRS
ncbi:hypothetical protein B296_00043978 [Ensete ventricosum]|uniref:Uncharacterized protein n=1 Tax=Ensete ventricosum TaxID=4639 RepID=A0A426Y8Z2_ENSVE|nr:hypothetical protein B296_00043978 [Ensete ventricosum]